MNSLTILRRSLRARLFSTLTTTLMVAVATGLMLLLLSLHDAGKQSLKRGSGDIDLVVSADPSPLMAVLDCVFYAAVPTHPMPWSKYLEIKDMPVVDYAVPTQQGDSFRGLPVVGTIKDYFADFKPDGKTPWHIAQGRLFDENKLEVILGAAAARAGNLHLGDHLFLTHGIGKTRPTAGDFVPAGQPVTHQEEDPRQDENAPHLHTDFDFEIVGILDPTATNHDRALFIPLNGAWLLHAHDRKVDPPDTIAQLLESDRKITGIYLHAKTLTVIPIIHDYLRRHSVVHIPGQTKPEDIDAVISVASPTSEIDNLFDKIISSIDLIFQAMAAVVMVGSAIGIMLAMYNSMEQRRRQTAVLRVLGFSRQRILTLVVAEAAVIGLMGALAGLALCLLGGWLVAYQMIHQFGLVIEPGLLLEPTLAVLAATLLLACIAGLIPGVMAYRTPVARSLRPLG